MTPSTKV